MPEGYETEVGERGVTLSGGQKQRIAIARALLLDPRILILDDATSSVDTETEQEIQQALRTLMAGRTSFVIAQRLSTVQEADQILVLERGRIVARGAHDELLRGDGFYREMHELQRREQGELSAIGYQLSVMGEGRRMNVYVDPDDLLGKAYDPLIARRLFAFVLPYRQRAIAALLLILVATVSDLLLPKLFSMAVDEVTLERRLSVLNLLGVAFLVALVVRFLASWGEFYQISWLGNRIVFDIRNQMFRHLQTLNVGYVDRRGVGSIMSRIQNDVGVINEFFSDAVAGIFGSSLILVGIVVLMLWTNWKLALLSFAVLPVMVLVMRFWRERAIATYRATRRTIAIVNANLAESIAGVRVAQAFTREPANIRHFERLSRDNLEASIDAAKLSSILFPIVSLIGAIATATTVYVGGQLVLGETLTIGELVLFIALIDRFFEPIRDLSQQYNVLQAAMVAGERIFEVLDVEPEVRDRPDAYPLPPIDGRVDYTHVSFGYGETEILHDVDLHIAPGETVALVGRDGGGQELDDQSAAALRRRLVRQCRHRWPRRAGRDADVAPLATGGGAAGHLPLRRHGAGQHRLRAAGGESQGGRVGGAGGGGARLHRRPARRVRDGDSGAGRQSLRRAAAIALLRAGAAGRSADSDPGRSDEQHRYADRAGHSAGVAAAVAGADLDRDCAPAVDDPRGGHDRGDARGADRGAGDARGIDGGAGAVFWAGDDAVGPRP